MASNNKTSPRRMICLPDDERIDESLVHDQRVREDEALHNLAKELLRQKIRPTEHREDAVVDLARWLRSMLLGPAAPLNKETDFVKDILHSTEIVADAEIYFETLPSCDVSLIERNRADSTKRAAYPDPQSPLRVREDVLRNKCIAMVGHFAELRNVTDTTARDRAVEHFYDFYLTSLTKRYPPSYNSYTGMMAMMNTTFLKQSEDIVIYGLGLTDIPPEGLVSVRYAPPPMHAVAVFALTLAMCVGGLPSLESIDEHATTHTFTKGGPLRLPPMALAIIRLTFAIICTVVTVAKIRRGSQFKIVRLPGSKLPGGVVEMKGWRTQGFYTSCAWNLLGISFLLGGMIPLLLECGREDVVRDNPCLLRAAMISFEIAAPSAFLTSVIVTYALWPRAYKEHGASGTVGFKGPISLAQHNGNCAMVLFEVLLMSGLPVMMSHVVFALLFGLLYISFVWFMINRWSPKTGPVFPYFFLDTTLGARTTIFMVALIGVMGLFFVLFALLDACINMVEQDGYGIMPNICFFFIVSFMVMKFKD